MRVLAPAKINLHLRVGPPRADGFHPLLTWMCTVGLYDELEIEPTPRGIEFHCDDPSIPADETNLVVKAARAIGATARITLTKKIPAGGGLAGGSSDAASTLMALGRENLQPIAAKLGSDVAFFLRGGSAVCTGLGETVRPINPPACGWAVLILPPFGMPTPVVYKKFDEMNLGRSQSIETEPDWFAWTELSAEKLLPHLVNDLEPPAFALNPQLRQIRDDWERRLGRPVRMSGSGSTLFTLFDTHVEANAAAAGENIIRVVELAPRSESPPAA
jgi:4-diphosphocytidyl-2-C-methyl-D-erythritol kinase